MFVVYEVTQEDINTYLKERTNEQSMGSGISHLPIFYSYWWAHYVGRGESCEQAKQALVRILMKNHYDVQRWKGPRAKLSSEYESVIYIYGRGFIGVKYEKVGNMCYATIEREDLLRFNARR